MSAIGAIDYNKKILFLDTSYIVFYRYYSLVNWWKLSHEDSIDTSVPLPQEFLDKYMKTFKEMISSLKKRYNISCIGNIVFAKDCSRDAIWRMKHYPEYKGTRDDIKRQQSFHKQIFEFTFQTVLPQIQGVTFISHPHLEADDCIAITVKHIRTTLNYDTEIIVITNDNDYVQLHIYDVTLCNLQHKSLFDRIDDVHTYIELKRIMGDVSDNIPAIATKIGPKTAKSLIENPDKLAKKLECKECRDRYEINHLLVHFDRIPEEYIHDFITMHGL